MWEVAELAQRPACSFWAVCRIARIVEFSYWPVDLAKLEYLRVSPLLLLQSAVHFVAGVWSVSPRAEFVFAHRVKRAEEGMKPSKDAEVI